MFYLALVAFSLSSLQFVDAQGSSGDFDPFIKMESCTRNYLKFRLYNASDGGVVFVKGQTVTCQEPTNNAETLHSFHFISCGIVWGEIIPVVVQKHATYQTGSDKTFPLECSPDLQGLDLTVETDLMLINGDDDNETVTVTVRPTVTMTLRSAGKVVNGKNISLSQTVEMSLKLGSEYLNDFDIEARSCTARTIPIVQNFCSSDEELFPNFEKESQGSLQTEFGAFRVTDTRGGEVEMIFTCVLKVCLGNCTKVDCNENSGRRRRRETLAEADDTFGLADDEHFAPQSLARYKRNVVNDVNDITVGAKLIVTDKNIVLEENPDVICIDPKLLLGVLAGVAAVLGGTMIASQILKKKARKADGRIAARRKGRNGP